MKQIRNMFVGIVCAALLVMSAVGATNAQPWNLEFSGAGSTIVNGDSESAIGMTLGISKDVDIILPAEIGFRQSLGWVTEESIFSGTSEVFADWQLFSYKKFQFLAGGNLALGYDNADDVDSSVVLGPEATIKYFVKDDVFLFSRIKYGYDFVNSDWDDSLRYNLGVGFKF